MAQSLSPTRVGPTVLATVEVELARAVAAAGGDAARLHAMVVKAAANALTLHRLFTWAYNGAYRVFPTDRIDIRVPAAPGADARPTVVRDADKKTLDETDAELRRAARRGEDGRERPPLKAPQGPFGGVFGAFRLAHMALSRGYEESFWKAYREEMGTFLVSNVGPLGIRDFASPVRTPSIVELGVCAPFQKAVLAGGVLASRPFLHLVGRLDHRMTDVAQTARFLLDVKKNIEAPETALGPTGE
jgi:pyruvate/2-oxoglutarate dehydrogenase complex dihydrolipoamide acyltransferase (E2) component